MPNYKGHLVGGVFTYALIIFIIGTVPSVVTAVEWLFFTLAGALFPDVDIKSKGQKYFYYGVFALFCLLAYQGCFYHISCCSFIVLTPMLVKHRGIFHRTWFVIAIPILIWMGISISFPHLSQQLFCNTLFFIIGALSHLFLDRTVRTNWRRQRR